MNAFVEYVTRVVQYVVENVPYVAYRTCCQNWIVRFWCLQISSLMFESTEGQKALSYRFRAEENDGVHAVSRSLFREQDISIQLIDKFQLSNDGRR